jgi:translocation and assembly module TamB
VDNIGVNTDLRWTLDKIELRGTRVDALGGRFTGTADIVDFARLRANGRIDGISLATVSRIAGVKKAPYSAGVSGPVEVTMTLGGRDLRAGGSFVLTPAAGGVPVRGTAQVAYDQRRNTIQLGNSHLLLPGTSIDASGTLGSELKVRLETRDFNDLLPALAIAGEAPEQLPLTLGPNGTAVFEGAVSGPLKTARATGEVIITNFTVQQQKVDRLVATIDADASSARIASFALGQDNLRLEGSATVGLENWKAVDAAPVKANLKLHGAAVEKLLAAAGQKELPVSGRLTASATVQGTVEDHRVAIKLEVRDPVVYGEKLDRIRAEVQYAGTGVEVINGVAELGSARVILKGAFEHAPGDYKNGKLRFDASTQGFALQSVANVQRLRPGVQGRFEMAATGSARLQNGELRPNRLDGVLGLRDLVVDGRAVGNFNVRADTVGTALNFTVAGNLRGSNVSGRGGFELTGDYPGKGSVEFSAITLSTLQDLMLAARGTEPMPFDGVVEGRVEFSGPAKKPELIRARMDLPALQIVPSRPGLTPAQTRDLTLRNEGPVVFEYDGKTVAIRSAHLVGRDTDMRATGTFALGEKNPWDLRVDGTLNLATVQNFNADVTSSGVAAVNASVRGSLEDPQMTGRMELSKASFYLTDLPNGLDNANGTILFDKRRATIEKLTAETGGGTISFAGFVGFGSELSYRLSARADNVRVRYPEGVSTTVSSTLGLTGSSTKSMLAGVVTVRRASFNPRTDVGGILASSARPVATPLTPNPYLRGMQLDVRVETAPGLQFQTALTNDLQAEADLRIRGTAARPTLLGRVSVNQGEVQFFGNKYVINRGEIAFYNPAKIEPVLDMDLETRVRGVLVTINFTGPLSRLNVSYRSDPPLQSTEIVALLAVGRAPGTNSSLASGQTVATQGFMSTGGNTLLGQAVAAPISGRLQRFFGVSRLKIDPQLTGINAVPQARLTVEQQVSRDVTLTYITNLAEANQQIVRVEWDITRNWSVVALREDNGAFGIDFFFKKRFK